MEAKYTLEPLTADEIKRWDALIQPFADREVFHSTAWLNYLAESQGIRIRQWSVWSENALVGYFCGGELKKGPFKILGSPLRGWGTNFLGPVLRPGIGDAQFLAALDVLAEAEEFDVIELEKSGFSETTMRAARYEATERWTYCVPLSSERETMLKRMSKGRRYGIKKATKSGLTVEQATDPAFADEFYEQFCALMAAKRAKPIFGAEAPRAMMKHLAGTGHLLALRVREDSGTVLATGLFPLDNRTLYYWGGASRLDRRHLCPNDQMHWHAMCVAADLGMESYDLSGWGRFKKEFGGELITTRRWHKSYSRSARWARRGYEFYSLQRNRILGQIQSRAQKEEA